MPLVFLVLSVLSLLFLVIVRRQERGPGDRGDAAGGFIVEFIPFLMVSGVASMLFSGAWLLMQWWMMSTVSRLDESFSALEHNPSRRHAPAASAQPAAGPPPGVLIASLEHVVPRPAPNGIKVVAGGLGKMLYVYLEHARASARPYVFAFPMVGGLDYAGFVPVSPLLDGRVEVLVYRDAEACGVDYVALRHPL